MTIHSNLGHHAHSKIEVLTLIFAMNCDNLNLLEAPVKEALLQKKKNLQLCRHQHHTIQKSFILKHIMSSTAKPRV